MEELTLIFVEAMEQLWLVSESVIIRSHEPSHREAIYIHTMGHISIQEGIVLVVRGK